MECWTSEVSGDWNFGEAVSRFGARGRRKDGGGEGLDGGDQKGRSDSQEKEGLSSPEKKPPRKVKMQRKKEKDGEILELVERKRREENCHQ